MIFKYTLRAIVVALSLVLMPNLAVAQTTTTQPQEAYGGVAVALFNYDVPSPQADRVESQTAERLGFGFHAYFGMMLNDKLGLEAFYTDLGDYEWEGDETNLVTARISPSTIGVAARIFAKETSNAGQGFFRIGAHSYSGTLQPTENLFGADPICGGAVNNTRLPTCRAQDEDGTGLLVGFGAQHKNLVYGLDYYTGLGAFTTYVGLAF
ncbi:MAG: hypothetical protein MJE68_07415 [Proteobacteria bacterium]|nr:hypothetical protein [Pseudomonadota bacterium]